jgi:hypothetical protein
MSVKDDVSMGYDLATAMLAADNIMREAFKNVRAFNAEQHPQFRGDVLRQVDSMVRSATLVDGHGIDLGRLAAAAENIGAETGFAAEALEKLAEVSSPAAGEGDRGQP